MSEPIFPQESIYNLLPKEEMKVEKPRRYASKFSPTVVLTNKASMKTMGPAKVEPPSTENYLKKHSKEPKLPDKKDKWVRTRVLKKPAVPAKAEKPPVSAPIKRDYIKPSIVMPMKPQPKFVDNHKGNKVLCENSGLDPKYIKKRDYGKIPEYLQRRKEEQRRAQEELDNFVKEKKEQEAMKPLSDEERQAVLEGLKSKWDKLHHEYQGLSLVTDMLSKKSRKERLEVAMKQVENNIDKFERFKTIYVIDN